MNAVEYILDGLVAALELERELGVRSVEIDRSLLASPPAVSEKAAVAVTPAARREELSAGREPAGARAAAAARPAARAVAAARPAAAREVGELVFLHDRPLSAEGGEMMAKILTALGRPQAPIVVGPPVPRAKVTVVLGGLALRKCFPAMKGGPGQWQRLPDGRDVLITYSPEYILRFGEVTPAVDKIKHDMWNSLKAVRQRLSPA